MSPIYTMAQNGHISSSQHGFFPGRPCFIIMSCAVGNLNEAYAGGLVPHVIFVDFAIDFDRGSPNRNHMDIVSDTRSSLQFLFETQLLLENDKVF